MQTESNKNRVTVNILDTEYAIVAEEESEYIKQLAQELDTRLRELHEKRTTMPPVKIAVLGALNLLDELHKLQAEYDALISMIKDAKF